MRWLSEHRRLLTFMTLELLHGWRISQRTQPPWQRVQALIARLREDWTAQKHRLLALLGFSLLASCFALAALMLTGIVALLLSWQTAHFKPTCLLVIGSYSLMAIGCTLRVWRLLNEVQSALSASRCAITAAIAQIK